MKKVNILYLCLLFVYLAVAGVALYFAFQSVEFIEEKSKIVGGLLALSSVPHLILFGLRGGFKNNKNVAFAMLGVIGVTVGVAFMLAKEVDLAMLNTFCLVWGIFDIVRSSYELTELIPEVQEKKWLELIEVFISVGEIVIAILLIMDRFEGIKLHFLYLGISFVAYFVKFLIQKFVEKEE